MWKIPDPLLLPSVLWSPAYPAALLKTWQSCCPLFCEVTCLQGPKDTYRAFWTLFLLTCLEQDWVASVLGSLHIPTCWFREWWLNDVLWLADGPETDFRTGCGRTEELNDKNIPAKNTNYGRNKHNANIRSFVREKVPQNLSKFPRKEMLRNLRGSELYKETVGPWIWG